MKNFFNYAKNRFLYSLLKIIGLLLLGFIASNFLLINNVFAETVYGTEFIATLYDNNNGSLSSVTTTTSSSGWTGQVGFIANSSGAAWGFNLKSAMIEGHTYALSMDISTSNATGSDIIFSTYNRIGLGSSLNSAVSSYQNSTNTELLYTNNVNGILQFVFKATSNGSYLVVPFCTSYSINTERVYFVSYVIEDLGASSSVNQDTINSSLNNQTNEINNSISNSENNIKDSINSTEGNLKDSITNSENNIKDGIKEGFENCRDSYNLLNNVAKSTTINGITFTINNDGSVTVNGTATYNAKLILTNYFNLDVGDYKLIEGNSDYLDNAIRSTYNDSNGNLKYLSSSTNKFTVASGDYNFQIYIVILQGKTVNNLTFYPMVVKYDNRNISYEKFGEKICSNRIDDTNNKLDEAENTRKSIWQTIKDLPGAFLNMLKSLIIPDNFDFIYDFKDSLENKLGFIASVPMQFINYLLSLPNKVFTPITSISFPEIEVFGTKFWTGQDVDITEGLSWFNGIKCFGDILCVILMVNTLNKWWKKFGGGNE